MIYALNSIGFVCLRECLHPLSWEAFEWLLLITVVVTMVSSSLHRDSSRSEEISAGGISPAWTTTTRWVGVCVCVQTSHLYGILYNDNTSLKDTKADNNVEPIPETRE